MEIGAQLYTLRDFCKTLEDFDLTLKKVADIGYKNVQVSAVCPYTGEWLDQTLKKYGLKCVVTHTPKPELTPETAEETVKKHNLFGCKNIGLGYYNFPAADGSDYEEYYKTFKPVAEKIAAAGSLFMHHNHNSEFKRLPNGKLVIEQMAEDFSPREMGFILDTFWVQAGGADPAQWIENFAGRIPCIHLKDYDYRPQAETNFKNYFAVIGEGNINFDRVFAAAEKSGVKYMLVEQDNCYGENPFDCLKRSYDNLVSYGFK